MLEIKIVCEHFGPTFVPKTLNDDVSGSIALNKSRERLNRLPPGRHKSIWICQYIDKRSGMYVISLPGISGGLDPAIMGNS